MAFFSKRVNVVGTEDPAYKPYIPTLGRYCTASATWFAIISSFPARSAIVRANFSTRWYALADKCNYCIAALSNLSPDASV